MYFIYFKYIYFSVGRKIGKAIVVIKNLEEISTPSENMEIDESTEEPIQKKIKTNKNHSDENDIILL